MKKKTLSLSLASLCLILTGCSETAKNITPILPDNGEITSSSNIIEADKEHAHVVSSKNGRRFEKGKDEDAFIFPNKVRLHYHRDDGAYAKKRFWIWSKSGAPEIEFEMKHEDDPEDDWSKVFEFDPKEVFKSSSDDSFSFMVKEAGSWGNKSAEIPILYKDYPATKQDDGTYVLDLYIIAVGSGLNIFKTKEDAMSDQIDIAFISEDYKKINIYTRDGTKNGSSVIENLRIYKFNHYYDTLDDDLKLTLKSKYLLFKADNVNKTNTAVKFKNKLAVNNKYVVEASFVDKPGIYSTYTINFDNLYNTPEFTDLNYKGDDLGAKISEDGKSTTFKVWAPTAASIGLKIYERGYGSNFLPVDTYENIVEQSKCDSYTYYDMTLNLHTFVWEVTIPQNLNGYYYTYQVSNSAGLNDVVDPYAYSAGMKGLRGMVIDLNDERAKPENWDQVPLKWDGTKNYDIKTTQELAISEVHIRDLTMDETWGGPKELAGTYKGFITEGTRYHENIKTGYDHLVEYGVNALQILPVFDFDNGERGYVEKALNPEKPTEMTRITDYSAHDKYNWGYNPLNYNLPEGGYSSDPRDGFKRVYEFRELISKFALNENHTRIIMDVVYNHVSSAPTSSFERLMPKYYFRFDETGGYADASGCGNEVKTEAPMMRKFIIDGLKHWAIDYKIKGFRFDLMGAIDMQTLSDLADELYKIDPDIVIYGEGWHSSAPQLPGGDIAINVNIGKNLQPGRDGADYNGRYSGHGYVGGFNNGIRDSLKGDNDIKQKDNFKGFIGGKTTDMHRVKVGLLGGNGNGDHPMHTLQNVNYVSCHDNYSLFDQLNWLICTDSNEENKHNNANLEPDINTVAQASVAVNGMVLMSNAISFISGGEEIFRTKIEDLEDPKDSDLDYETKMYGKRISHNSYKSADTVNAYDYSRKEQLYQHFEGYKKLVQIKKQLDYSQCYVDGSAYKAGDAANIETGDNANDCEIGLYRKGKDGSAYHAYISSTIKDNTFTIPAGATVLFSNANETISGTTCTNKNWYSLIVIKE